MHRGSEAMQDDEFREKTWILKCSDCGKWYETRTPSKTVWEKQTYTLRDKETYEAISTTEAMAPRQVYMTPIPHECKRGNESWTTK